MHGMAILQERHSINIIIILLELKEWTRYVYMLILCCYLLKIAHEQHHILLVWRQPCDKNDTRTTKTEEEEEEE